MVYIYILNIYIVYYYYFLIVREVVYIIYSVSVLCCVSVCVSV